MPILTHYYLPTWVFSLAANVDSISVQRVRIGIVELLRGADGSHAAVVAIAHVVGALNRDQVCCLVDDDVRLVGDVAGIAGSWELEPVGAENNLGTKYLEHALKKKCRKR